MTRSWPLPAVARLNPRAVKIRRRAPLATLTLLIAALGGGPAVAEPRMAGKAPSASETRLALPSVEPAARKAKPRGPSTLDPQLQQASERLLRGAKPVEGAIVALDPNTGRVLAFRALTSGASEHELLTQARLPAASLFKVVTATALFETTSLSPQDKVCISGGMHGIERRHLEAARGAGADCGRFAWALGHSKNAVFAQLATRLLTRDDLAKTAERLGFNARLTLDDGAEQADLGKLNLPYNDLEFARAAAGFQGSSLSPIGAAYLLTLIARGGAPIELRLHDGIPSHEPEPLAARAPAPFSARTAQRLTRMLEVTVETGTSRAAFTAPDGKRYLPGIRVAGKTGTLRPGQGEETMTSWFVGFAPSRNPEVVVSVMLVNGHTYRRKANELARDLLRTYFRAHGRAGSVTDPFAEAAPEAIAASP
jgi:peptidoglycan glycosyltransferase